MSLVGTTSSSQSTSSSSSSQQSMDKDELKVGVLLLNLGGPEKTDDVEGMHFNLRVSHASCKVNLTLIDGSFYYLYVSFFSSYSLSFFSHC